MAESSTDELVQLYEHFCRLCWGLLSLERYNLDHAWSMAKAATVTGEDHFLGIECVPHICKSCYIRLDLIAKKEEVLAQAKEQACGFLKAGRPFHKSNEYYYHDSYWGSQ